MKGPKSGPMTPEQIGRMMAMQPTHESEELAKLRAEVADWRGQAHRSQSDADRLESENAELRKDAERLNYIADFCKFRHLNSGFWSWQTMLSSSPHLRDAIDAAMKGQT